MNKKILFCIQVFYIAFIAMIILQYTACSASETPFVSNQTAGEETPVSNQTAGEETPVTNQTDCKRLSLSSNGSENCPPNGPSQNNIDIELDSSVELVNLSCLANSDQLCSTTLSLSVRGGSGDSSFDPFEPDVLFQFDVAEIKKQFSPQAILQYSIVQGNPEFTLPSTTPAGALEIFDLVGYRIDDEGKLYIKDSWLFSRNSDKYDDQSEPADFISRSARARDKTQVQMQNERACGNSLSCPNGTVYTLNFHFMEYTHGRTQNDLLTVRVKDISITNGKEIDFKLAINANPSAVRLSQQCAGSVIEKWSCQYARELIPHDDIITTDEHRKSLPDALLKDKSEYDLVANIEFDNLEHTKKYMNVTTIPDSGAKNIQLEDGKLIIAHTKHDLYSGFCTIRNIKGRPLTTIGKFEPGLGYLEFNIVKYPNLSSNGGNIVLWSRYGVGHDAFRSPPKYLFNHFKNSGLSISRRELAKIGFIEVDFFERWFLEQETVFFVTHSWPQNSYLYGIHVLGREFHATSHWFKTYNRKKDPDSLNVAMGAENFSMVVGVEITPQSIQIYQDGESTFSKDSDGFFSDTAKYILMHGIYKNRVPCDVVGEDERIEIDYIRFYKPRSGYESTE